jgi:hypothetical protein
MRPRAKEDFPFPQDGRLGAASCRNMCRSVSNRWAQPPADSPPLWPEASLVVSDFDFLDKHLRSTQTPIVSRKIISSRLWRSSDEHNYLFSALATLVLARRSWLSSRVTKMHSYHRTGFVRSASMSRGTYLSFPHPNQPRPRLPTRFALTIKGFGPEKLMH